MQRGYKVRLLPTPEQAKLLRQHCNAARWTWNWALAKQMQAFRNAESFIGSYAMRDAWKEARPDWVADCAVNDLVTTIFDLDVAYKRFFKLQKSGIDKFTKKARERAARQKRPLTELDMQGHPQFKSKCRSKLAYGIQNDKVSFYEKGVSIPKVGKVAYQTDAPITVGRNATKVQNPRICFIGGKWILSFSLEIDSTKPILKDICVGIDLGVKTLATISCNGEITKIKNINKTSKIKKLEKQLKRMQRRASRRAKNSKNQEKTYKQVASIQARLRNIRRDYTHKATRSVVDMLPRAIGIEDLNVRGMMKNRHLSKAIQDCNFSEIRRQLEYKSELQGTQIVLADRFYLSSKKCSCCGAIKHNLRLSDRLYVCESCGAVIDRDDNAAKNLEMLALSV